MQYLGFIYTKYVSYVFSQIQDMILHANCPEKKRFPYNVKAYFRRGKRKISSVGEVLNMHHCFRSDSLSCPIVSISFLYSNSSVIKIYLTRIDVCYFVWIASKIVTNIKLGKTIYIHCIYIGSSLTQPSGIPYFSLYTFLWSTCISNDPGPECFVQV